MKRNSAGRTIGILILLGFTALFIWGLTRPHKAPETRRMQETLKTAEASALRNHTERDALLIKQLISEDLGKRRFRFSTVISASSGQQVLPLERSSPIHISLLERLEGHLERITKKLGQEGSPVRSHRRINEVSRHFEDALISAFESDLDWQAGIPPTRDGRSQRSGYPDIRLEHTPSGSVFYLDPKLVEQGSWKSSFRSFYFEPKDKSLKINDDAVHLLVGIEHDGNDGAWQFTDWKIIDLSKLTLRLKPEFQASNADLYVEP